MYQHVKNEKLEQLKVHMKRLELDEYRSLSDKLVFELEGEALGELLYYRSQIKALTFDKSLLEDSVEACKLLTADFRLMSLFKQLELMDPNSFILFKCEENAVSEFFDALSVAGDVMQSNLSVESALLFRQIQSEILYFWGRFDEALRISREINRVFIDLKQYDCATMSSYCMIRCYLAMGLPDMARESIMNLIHLEKTANSAGCSEMYRTIRMWLNLTTGWSGDTPRYYTAPDGSVLPVLLDRTDAINKGISDLGSTELPLAKFASESIGEIYTVRQLFTEIYTVIVKHSTGVGATIKKEFSALYTIARANNFKMPFVEYGAQILPLISSFINEDGYDSQWLAGIIDLAERYELSLREFRCEGI